MVGIATIMEPGMPDTYTVEEAAKKLGIGRNSCYEAARTGQLPSIRIGKRILVPRAALERLLSGAPEKAAK
jgi:excisionase family DNA binding protein